MKLPLVLPLVVGAPLFFGLTTAAAAENYHPWTHFEVGSWKQVRVVTETLDAQGNVEGVKTTDTKTTLTQIEASGYTLKVEATVEVAGRRFQSEPKFVKQGFYGEALGQPVEVKAGGAGEVLIEGRRYPTRIEQVVIGAEGSRRISTFHWSTTRTPYLLKQESRAAGGGEDALETVVEVLAVDMPYRVLTQVKPAAFVRTVRVQRGVVLESTIETKCVDVPGAVVAHSAHEFDATGRVISRSVLELTDYEVVRTPPSTPTSLLNDNRRRLFSHRRTRRP